MKALVVGATGATGKPLVARLLSDPRVSRVETFVRRPSGITHPKLIEHVVDFDKIEEWKSLLTGDILFSLMGTTAKQAGSRKAQYLVDYTYQFKVAQACAQNGVSKLSLLSSNGASSRSLFPYLRMKGELEDSVRKLPFSTIDIFRPGLLERPGSDRFGEKISERILNTLSHFGLPESYLPLPTNLLADRMIAISLSSKPGLNLHSQKELSITSKS